MVLAMSAATSDIQLGRMQTFPLRGPQLVLCETYFWNSLGQTALGITSRLRQICHFPGGTYPGVSSRALQGCHKIRGSAGEVRDWGML